MAFTYEELLEQVSDLEYTVDALKYDRDELNKECEKMQARYESDIVDLESDIVDLKSDIDVLKEDLESWEMRYDILQARYESLQDHLGAVIHKRLEKATVEKVESVEGWQNVTLALDKPNPEVNVYSRVLWFVGVPSDLEFDETEGK